MMTTLLTREDILDRSVLKTERVEVPEWGGIVIIRELTGNERDEWESELVEGRGDEIVIAESMAGARARLASLAIVDEDGERLFTVEDVESLGRLSGAALGRVFDVASRLSGLTADDIEELSKNLPGTGIEGSGSSSPSS